MRHVFRAIRYSPFALRSSRGLTLLEIMITVSLFVVMGSVAIMSVNTYRNRHLLTLTIDEIVATLRRAQASAMAQENSSAWGVHFENRSNETDFYILYYGSSYASGTAAIRKPLSGRLEFSDPSVASGTKDVLFAKATGLPGGSTSVTIVSLSQNPSPTITITVNTQGEVSKL